MLEELNLKFESHSVVVIKGLGGMGKSVLANAYGHKYSRDKYQIVAWINDETEDTRARSFQELAYKFFPADLHKDLPSKSSAEIQEMVINYLENEPFEKRWLLILDNHEPNCTRLPKNGHGHILLTCQHNPYVDCVCIFEMPRFSRDEAVNHFKEMIGEQESDVMEKLADALGNIPLLIHLAAKYLSITPVSVVDYYQTLAHRLKSPQHGLLLHQDEDYTKSLTEVWLESFRVLQSKNPLAAEWLEVCAYLNAENIPTNGIRTWLEQKGINSFTEGLFYQEAILRDIRSMVIDMERSAETFSLHRHLQDIIREQIQDRSERHTQTRQLLQYHLSELSFNDSKTWHSGAMWYPHAKSFSQIKFSGVLGLEEAAIYEKMATYHLIEHNPMAALACASIAAAILSADPPANALHILLACKNDQIAAIMMIPDKKQQLEELKGILMSLVKINAFTYPTSPDNFDEKVAEEILRQTINISAILLTLIGHDVAVIARGQLELAEAINERLHPQKENLFLAKIWMNLGVTWLTENVEKSITYFEQAIGIFEKNQTNYLDHYYSSCVAQLGVLYANSNQNEKAIRCIRLALSRFEMQDQGDSLNKANTLHHLGLVCPNLQEAVDQLQASNQMYQRIFSNGSHPYLLRHHYALSKIFMKRGHYPKSLHEAQAALDISLNIFDEKSKEIDQYRELRDEILILMFLEMWSC